MDSALSLLLAAGQPFDYAQVRDLADPKLPDAPALVLSGKPALKIYDGLLTGSLATAAGGVRMMDTDTSVMQERIGQLCHQFNPNPPKR